MLRLPWPPLRALPSTTVATLALVSAALTTSAPAVYAENRAISAANVISTATPIVVEADDFVVYLADEKAVWRGNVLATQGNYTFRTSQLTVHLDDIARSAGTSERASTNSQSTRNAVELSADRVTYDIERDEIQGLGNSELRRGVEFIRADNIIYEVTRRTARAEPGTAGRVRVQFLSAPDSMLFPAALGGGAE